MYVMKSKATHLIGIVILVAIHIECGTGDIQHIQHLLAEAPNRQYRDSIFDGESTATEIPMIGCQSSPCGPHAECIENNGGDYTCKCMTDFVNRPPNCRPECTTDSHCPDDMNCMNYHCRGDCGRGMCGPNAECNIKNHKTKCVCKENFIGDPYHQCILQRNLSGFDPCESVECGNNTKCVKQNGVGLCQCLPNYIGNPYDGCTGAVKSEQKCAKHTDCSSNRTCIQNKCINPCPDFCPENAECKISDHILICSCKVGYTGDNYRYCSKIEENDQSQSRREQKVLISECIIDDECLVNTTCVENQCVDPCVSFTCGAQTKCSVVEHSPVCNCLIGYTGDPNKGCHPIPVFHSLLALDVSIDFIGGAITETTLLPLFDSISNYTEYKMTIEPADAIENVIYVKKEREKIGFPDAGFSGLKSGRAYNVSIQAKMGDRLSVPFSKIYRTMPLHPLNLALDTQSLTTHSFRVIWQTPSGVTEFDEYDLVVGNQPIPRPADADDDDTEIRQQPPPLYEHFREYRMPRSENETNEFSIDMLRPGETYEVAVKTVSAEYTESSAISIDVTTRPLPVKSLQFSIDVDTEYVTLQWSPNELSRQDEYKIDYYYDDESGIANKFDRTTIQTNDTSYIFQSLLPNKDYSFFVLAISKSIESNETAIYLPKRHS